MSLPIQSTPILSKTLPFIVENITRELQDLVYQTPVFKALSNGVNLRRLRDFVKHVYRSNEKLFTLAESVVEVTDRNTVEIDIPAAWSESPVSESPPTFKGSLFIVDLEESGISKSPEISEFSGHSTKLTKWHQASWPMIFKSAYQQEIKLRPDVKGTYRVKLTKNVRLTPLSYHRNIFHMEMDTSDTGLKYEIGDALGVYGHNDPVEVDEFLRWYKLNPSDIVSINRDGQTEMRRLDQLFTQVLDIFGRPTTRFYEALAEHAKDPTEKQSLLFLLTPEGKPAYQNKIAETVTYADVLREFPSAHPPPNVLIEMIPPIKARHYSIASSMKIHPNSVHLLVVVHDWVTPSGKTRIGQCTRYLASLDPSQNVYLTVSVVPSILKLPPKHEMPVVMAGLGTGMAPFRAFIEERAYYKSIGEKVGPMILYFGSRHRAEEYLYGEELEAYHQDGLLTGLKLAFSRDQEQKVYIQNKIGEDGNLLWNLMMKNEGYFYLCGPTWPVGDIQDAMVKAFCENGGMNSPEASKAVKELKHLERYVLEVY
eukprot:TRINITY_DN9428_c0_g1_i5.p1 TRINITY_DN9428_c0_g1~~TRINITY_DN9428_c0_g1_i5.p1  ORF type:complete len:539 (-),score=94.18 TRINITY_DN9428_c0_g1_i5:17-1633(-)